MDINQVWPEWQEDCVLGEGSFGKVFRAKRVEYGRTFYSAIKVLTVPKSQQEVKFAQTQGMNESEIYDYFRGVVDNLLNEITLMDNLKGAQNVVGIEDYKIIERQGEIGWDIFIRMELLTPFDSFVSNPEFSQKDVIRLGVDICTALEVCELNRIVHRDIKPDNIFISRFGEYKLGDFGIARKLEATQANLSRKGTLNYMAPEVYKSEEYGSNVDIYSLGLVLYTLLNNNRIAFLPPYPQPISYKDNEEALTRRLSGEPLPLPCNAGASLGAAIVKACAYRPQDRYHTATEFKNALIAEWNVLVQSGDNRDIKSDAMRFSGNLNQKLQNTTNDMTANGRLVVKEYAESTTVLEDLPQGCYGDPSRGSASFGSPASGSVPSQPPVSGPASFGSVAPNFVAGRRGNLPEDRAPIPVPPRSNKLCRILAFPLAILLFALFVLTMQNETVAEIEMAAGIPMMGIGMVILLADRNKRAVALCVSELSLPYVKEGLTGLLGNGIQQSVPAQSVVFLLSGLLLFVGGLVIFFQKEARFGGSLCLYSFAVEGVYYLYQLINQRLSIPSLWHIFSGVAAFAVFIWSYGYKSDAPIVGVRKVFHIIAYALASALAFSVVAFTAMSVQAGASV